VTYPKGVEVIRKHTRRAAKAAFAISLGVAIVIGLFAAAFARPAQSAGTTVVLGTKNFGEEYILGQLYKQALEAKGFKVTYKENIGSTELIQTSLTSGKINMYPEYMGVIVQDVFRKTSPKTAAATYALAKSLEGAKGYTVLKPTPFFDTDQVAVTNATAKKYGLKVISDLNKAGNVKFDLRLRSTRCGQGPCRRRVLDRSAACEAVEVHGPLRPEARDGLPERRTDRQDVGGNGARPEVHADGQRRVGEADPAGDHRDEQGVLRRQAVGSSDRQGIPEGQRAQLRASCTLSFSVGGRPASISSAPSAGSTAHRV
jgi:hypothetical protein